MVIIITGATHTGKTALAQKLLERLHIPYLSIDHLKMGLIRSGYTDLTPDDDEELTEYMWPVVREMIKTAIENRQDLTVEGCYIPYDWRKELEDSYLADIRFVCLCLSDGYIDTRFDDIRSHACDIEKRIDDSWYTAENLKEDNRKTAAGFINAGEKVVMIEDDYERTVAGLLDGLTL